MSAMTEYTAPSGLSLIIAMAGNVRAAAVVPEFLEIPDIASSDLKIYLVLYDADGEMQVPDAAPIVSVVNNAGTDRSSNLRNGAGASTTMVNESVGVYWLYYRVLQAAIKEGLVFTFTSIINAKTLTVKAASEVGDIRDVNQKITYISEELQIVRTYGMAEAGSDTSHLICSSLTRSSGNYADWHLFMITGVNAGLMRRVGSWSLATHRVTLADAFPGVIGVGDEFELISINASANKFIGQNDSTNLVDTSLVTADRDGSLLERVEDIRNLEDKRVSGRKQIVQVEVTANADAGPTTLFEAVAQNCIIEDAVIRAKAAAPAQLTTCALNASIVGHLLPLIVIGLATQANLNTIGKQVGSTDLTETPVGATIVIDLQGTGGTAVDLIVTIGYRACTDGGYMNPV